MLAKSLNMLHKIILTHCLAANMLSAVTSNNGTQVWFTKARTLASNDLFHPHPRMTFCFCKNVLYSVNKRLFVRQTLINEDIDPFFFNNIYVPRPQRSLEIAQYCQQEFEHTQALKESRPRGGPLKPRNEATSKQKPWQITDYVYNTGVCINNLWRI